MDRYLGSALLRENVPLAPYTTLEIGGPARFLLDASEEDHVLAALEFAGSGNWPVFVLGGGSNVLVSDAGFPGIVIRMALHGVTLEDDGRGAVVRAAAGEPWDPFVEWCVARDLAGLECLSGIPGTVGGTPVQNVGAYGQEVSEVIERVRVLHRETLGITELANRECGFYYRSSIFNGRERERYIILSVTYGLRPSGAPCLQYADLQRLFSSRPAPSLADTRSAVLGIRAAKAMLLTPDDPDCRSAGSFFKNPVIDQEMARLVEEAARSRGLLAASENMPWHRAKPGLAKLPAAWLIERAGFKKGYQRGRAGISGKHTLALVNRGGASANDILLLMREIQNGVQNSFGIELKPEPIFVGFQEL